MILYQNTDFIDLLLLNKIMKVQLLKNQKIVHILANSSEIFLSFTISSFKYFSKEEIICHFFLHLQWTNLKKYVYFHILYLLQIELL